MTAKTAGKTFKTHIDLPESTRAAMIDLCNKQLAAALRLPASKVSRALALLSLPADLQTQVDDGTLPARTAYELSKVADDRARREMARLSSAGTLTAAQVASKVRRRRLSRLRRWQNGGRHQGS